MKKHLAAGALALISILPLSGEIALSEKLTKIASHLGEGGVHYSVTDTTDDLKTLGQAIDEILKVVPEADLPPGFKVETLFGDLGLLTIEGKGSSSHELDGLWHNRTFFLTDGTFPGVLSVFGDEARVPAAHEFAPSGADLVLETSLDLRKLVPMARRITGGLEPEAAAGLEEGLTAKVGNTGMTVADLFMDFTVHGTVVLWLDEEETVELGPGMSYPVPHLAARLDHAGLVWSVLKSELGPVSEIVEEDGEVILVPKDAKQETPIGILEPRFVWVPGKKQLFFSLTEGDLAVCRGDGPRLTVDADFKRATEGFPEKANGLAYASKDFLKTLVKVAGDFSGQVPPDAKPMVDLVLPYLSDIADQGGFAKAFSVDEEGLLFVANLPVPLKGGGFSSLGGIATVSMLAGMTTPLILRAQNKAEEAESVAEVKAYAMAQLTYQVEYGRFANSLPEMVEKDIIDAETATEWKGRGLEILVEDGKPGKGDMLGFFPNAGRPDLLAVAFTNGSARVVGMEEIQAIRGRE